MNASRSQPSPTPKSAGHEPLKPSEVLAKAADLIEPKKAWTKSALGRIGGSSSFELAKCTCWCAMGAIVLAKGVAEWSSWQGGIGEVEARYVVRANSLPVGENDPIGDVESWNDADPRTQKQVVAALRKASELAKAEGQ